MITLIAAVARNGTIGMNGAMPWRLPEDLRFFRFYTSGKFVLAGRKTADTLPHLTGRHLLILSRAQTSSFVHVKTVEEAVRMANRSYSHELVVIGGAEVYAHTIEQASKLMITHVDADIPGDAFFPKIDPETWEVLNASTMYPANARHTHAFRFVEYGRRAGVR